MIADIAADDVTQTIKSSAAWALKAASTDGQRELLLLEQLTACGLDVRSKKLPAKIKLEISSANDRIEVKRRDFLDLSMLYRSAPRDASAQKHLDKVRSGEHRTGTGARSAWRREKEKTKQGRSYMKKSNLSRLDKKRLFLEVERIKAAEKTNGAKVIVLCSVLVELGFARLDQSGGPVSSEKIRHQIETALGVPAREIGHGLTILRKEALGELPAGSIEAIKSGRYTSCGTFLKGIAARPKKRVEVIKDDEWMLERAREVNGNPLLPSTTAKILAYQRVIVSNNVLDPTAQLSRRINAVADVAIGVLGCSRSEFLACWAVIRLIARGELDASEIDMLERGIGTATHFLNERGGPLAIARTSHAARVAKTQAAVAAPEEFGVTLGVGVEAAAPAVEQPVERPLVGDLVVADTAPAPIVAAKIGDPMSYFRSVVATACADTDMAIDLLKKSGNTEGLRVAELFRHEVGLAKMRVSQIMVLSSVTRRHRRAK